MRTYKTLFEVYEKYMSEADRMIKDAYDTKIKPEYEHADLLRGKLLLISEISSNEFISKKAKEKESELVSMLFDL